MTKNVAQTSTSMTRRTTSGQRWETYLLSEKIVPAVCYRVRSLLLGENTKTAKLQKSMWPLLDYSLPCFQVKFSVSNS